MTLRELGSWTSSFLWASTWIRRLGLLSSEKPNSASILPYHPTRFHQLGFPPAKHDFKANCKREMYHLFTSHVITRHNQKESISEPIIYEPCKASLSSVCQTVSVPFKQDALGSDTSMRETQQPNNKKAREKKRHGHLSSISSKKIQFQ